MKKITYFVTDGTYIKIGLTNKSALYKRIKQLQVGNPNHLFLLLTINGNYEQRFHEKYKEYHYRGEWFLFPELEDILKEIDINRENLLEMFSINS